MDRPSVTVPNWTPPRWLNRLMSAMLQTPGLERWLGRSIALITVTGRKSGRRYTTPVTYWRDDGTVVILSRASRRWWRNVESNPEVTLRLAGRSVRGRARASIGDEGELDTLAAFLEHRRADARAYGVGIDAEGRPHQDQLRALLGQIVVLRITLDPPTGRFNPRGENETEP